MSRSVPYFALKSALFFSSVEQVLPVEKAHRIVVERQHVGHAVDLADEVHELRHVDRRVELVGLDAVVERLQPARLGELADPVEIDDDGRVAALGRHQLRHQLGVHLRVVDDLEIDVDAGRLLELGHQRLDVFGVGHAFHQDVDGFGERPCRTWPSRRPTPSNSFLPHVQISPCGPRGYSGGWSLEGPERQTLDEMLPQERQQQRRPAAATRPSPRRAARSRRRHAFRARRARPAASACPGRSAPARTETRSSSG